MAADSIYVTLVSTTSNDLNDGKNTAAHFTNRLKNPLALTGEWEVALLDIQLPHYQLNVDMNRPVLEFRTNKTWNNTLLFDPNVPATPAAVITEFAKYPYTVTPDEMLKVRRMWRMIREKSDTYRWRLNMPTGSYTSIHAVITYMDIAMRSLFLISHWKFMEFDEVNGRVCYYLNSYIDNFKIINNEVSCMLGFTVPGESDICFDVNYGSGTSDFSASTIKRYAQYPPDAKNGQHSFFVYTDCIEICNVGDSTGQLLRQLDAHQTGLVTFPTPYYKPVLRSNIDCIEIDIRNLAGNNPRFQRSCTTCTLHFRTRV